MLSVSGKTSLIRILCGLAEADEGEVTWCGYNIQSYRSEYLQDLVYVAHANGIKTRWPKLWPLSLVWNIKRLNRRGDILKEVIHY